MQTECSADLYGFAPVEGRKVVAGFDGGTMTSEAGAMLLGATDGQIRLIERFAGCFTDYRDADLVEHTVRGLVGQRVFGIALGYEDLIDHDLLRHDPVMAVLGGKLEARRSDCAPLAGKSTLNRLELSREEPTRYHKISYDAARSAMTRRRSKAYLSTYFSTPMGRRRRRSRSISTPPTTRCTGSKKGVSSTAITTPTAICRFTCSAADICWRRSCGRRISTRVPAASRRWRGSSPGFASVGPMYGSCCAPIRALPGTR
jgi:Transposase DDE domain group 1